MERLRTLLGVFVIAVIAAASMWFVIAVFVSAKTDIRITLSDKDVREYAETAHVRIGAVDLHLPFIALPDYRSLNPVIRMPDEPPKSRWRAEKERFVAAMSDPNQPLASNRLTVVIDGYGILGELGKSSEICPHLERDWARALCLDLWHPLRSAVPPRFDLVDVRDPLDWMTQVQRDLVRSLDTLDEKAAYACEQSARVLQCSAIILIKEDLAVSWYVRNRPKESLAAMAVREGKALRAFVEWALGEHEDYAMVLQVACALRAPDSLYPVRENGPCADF